MGERREWWSNVYVGHRGPYGGAMHPTRASAAGDAGGDCVGRIHVRLKPEGAPRRYATAMDRLMWERDPVGMRQFHPTGPVAQRARAAKAEADRIRADAHLWLTDPALDGRRCPSTIERVKAAVRALSPSA